MKKDKKKWLYIILIVLFVIVISMFFRTNNGEPTKPMEDQVFSKVNDYDLFFGIDNLVNDYIDANDSGKIDNYFYSNEIYRITFTSNEYYVVVGEKVTYSYDTTKLEMKENVAYLINNDLVYSLYDIKEIDDYSIYLTGNNLYDNVRLKQGKSISQYKYNDANDFYIMNYYINYFKELLFVNYTKAYELLDNSYKKKVGSLEDFNSYREKIYGNLNNIIKDYSVSGEDGKRLYKIVLNNGMMIDFQEDNIMNINVKISNNE